MDPIFKVNLEGPGPYGFRVTGGVECNMPIRIALVSSTGFCRTRLFSAAFKVFCCLCYSVFPISLYGINRYGDYVVLWQIFVIYI